MPEFVGEDPFGWIIEKKKKFLEGENPFNR